MSMTTVAAAVIVLMIVILVAALCLAAVKVHNLTLEKQRLQQALNRAKKKLACNDRHKADRLNDKQNRLKQYLELMDTLVNTIANPIYYKDAEGVFKGCNRAFANDLLGLKRGRIIGKRAQQLAEVIDPPAAALWRRHELKMFDKKTEHSFEIELACGDGAKREFLVTVAPVKSSQGQIMGCVGVMLDLTERNRAAREKIQKEKLQGVLETAGAICHEFNQPLQALSGYAELAQSGISASDDYNDLVEKIRAQIERMALITRKLHNITQYAAKDYVGDARIIDIDKASGQ